MKNKKVLYTALIVIIFVIVFFANLLTFFPYKKILNIAVQNILTESSVKFSMDGIKVSPFSAHIKQMIVGFENIGKIVEIKNFDLGFDFFNLFSGNATVSGHDAEKKFNLNINIPLFNKILPSINAEFKGLTVEFKNDENTLIKGLKGKINGIFNKKIDLYLPEKTTGDFFITIREGETELSISGFPKMIVPFTEFAIKGTTKGNKTKIELLSLKSKLGNIKGSGEILSFTNEERVNINLYLEGFNKTPLSNVSEIKITGNLLNMGTLSFSVTKKKS